MEDKERDIKREQQDKIRSSLYLLCAVKMPCLWKVFIRNSFSREDKKRRNKVSFILQLCLPVQYT